jgi:hypothetical protein
MKRPRAVTSGYISDDSAHAGAVHLGRLRQVRVGSIVADTLRNVFGARGEGLMDQPLTVWGAIVGNRFLEKSFVTFVSARRRPPLE